jgi:hypothetical protein
MRLRLVERARRDPCSPREDELVRQHVERRDLPGLLAGERALEGRDAALEITAQSLDAATDDQRAREAGVAGAEGQRVEVLAGAFDLAEREELRRALHSGADRLERLAVAHPCVRPSVCGVRGRVRRGVVTERAIAARCRRRSISRGRRGPRWGDGLDGRASAARGRLPAGRRREEQQAPHPGRGREEPSRHRTPTVPRARASVRFRGETTRRLSARHRALCRHGKTCSESEADARGSLLPCAP